MAAKRKKRKSVVKGRRWSQRVTETSDALDLDKGVFSLASPRYRVLVETFRRAQPAAEKRFITLSHVDVDFLHQSRRPQTIKNSPRAARIREERTAFAVS